MNSISLTGALSEFIPFFIFFGFWMNSLSLTHALSEFMNFLHIFLGFYSLGLTWLEVEPYTTSASNPQNNFEGFHAMEEGKMMVYGGLVKKWWLFGIGDSCWAGLGPVLLWGMLHCGRKWPQQYLGK